MEIKYFVFGKFRDQLPDFGVRVKSPLLTEDMAESYSAMIDRLKQLCTIQINVPSYIEYIGQSREIPSLYFYTRFFSSKGNQDYSGREMAGCFHTMVFSFQDLVDLDFKPWVCRDRFVKLFDNEKILGWDGTVWYHRDEIGRFKNALKDIPLSLETPPAYNNSRPNLTNYEASDPFTQYISSINAYSTLEDLDADTLLRMFNMGIVLNYPVEYGSPRNISGFAKFVMGRSSLTEDFKKSNWRNLTPMSIKSYVNSLSKKVTQLPQTTITPVQSNLNISTETQSSPITPTSPPIAKRPDFVAAPVDEATSLNNRLTDNQNIIAKLKQQRTWLFIVVSVCFVGVAILSWIVIQNPAQPLPSPEPQVSNTSTIKVEHPEPPKEIQGEKVTKGQYDTVRSKFFKVDDLLKKVQTSYEQLDRNNKELQSKNTALGTLSEDKERQITNLSTQLKLQKDTLNYTDKVLIGIRNENQKLRDKIAAMPQHITDSIRRAINNDLKQRDTIKSKEDTTVKHQKVTPKKIKHKHAGN
jgi:hypothetical protein